MICAYMCIIHTCHMIQVLGPPASAGWVAKCTDPILTRRKNYLEGGFCSILALDPLARNVSKSSGCIWDWQTGPTIHQDDINHLYGGLMLLAITFIHMWLQCVLYMNIIIFAKHHPYRHSIELLSSQISQLILHTPHKAEGHSPFTTDGPTGITNMVYGTFKGQLLAPKQNRRTYWAIWRTYRAVLVPTHTHLGWGWGAGRPGSSII